MKQIRCGKMLTVFLAVILCWTVVCGWISWSNCTFEETFYTLYSSKIDTPVRALLLSDLHEAEFGKDNCQLVARIQQLQPDIILIPGDIITKGRRDSGYAAALCGQLSQIAPVYFSLGNHENEMIYGSDLNIEFLDENKGKLGENLEDLSPLIQDDGLLKQLKGAGVTVLQNESVTVQVQGNQIEIGGISTNLSSFWPYSGQFVYHFAEEGTERFKLLLSHRPEPVMEYIPGYPVDLVVSGHTHGGIVRIPGKGGLLSTDGGFFPQYDAGIIERGAMTMVISRGLGGHGLIPRVFNRPELVVIDLL